MELNDIWILITSNFIACTIIFFRVTGIFSFNPIFSRTNIPMQAKILMSLALSIFMIATFKNNVYYMPASFLEFFLTLLKEAVVGLVFGLFTNLFISIIVLAGDIVDNQIGFAMAKNMDPASGIQMPVFANIWFYMFILYFFQTGSHLEYIRIFKTSYEMLPINFDINFKIAAFIEKFPYFMQQVFVLAVKMSMPIIASQLIVEFAVGVIMKAVPSIQVFIINIQLKIFVGLMVAIIIAEPISEFIIFLITQLNSGLRAILNSL